MSQLSMRWLILSAAITLVAATWVAQPWIDPPGDSDLSAYELDSEQVQLSAELQVTQQIVTQRIAQKELLIAQLIDGHLTLDEVATEFLRINQESDICMAAIRDSFPGATDEERHANNVISFTLSRARSPEHQKALRERLEQEFEQRHGHSTH